MSLRDVLLGVLLLPGVACAEAAAESPQQKTRVIVLTDIGNEPDDSESMVRFLVYANELDVEGLLATTSTWQRDAVRPDLIEERVRAYDKVLPNLRMHATGYPDAQTLLSRIKAGRPAYGMSGVGAGKDTSASDWIVTVVDRADARPVWLVIWGGATDLAQALTKVRRERSAAEVATFVSRLRVYSISDQDDAGPWIRREFPALFWIASIHAFGDYAAATWPGISGDQLMNFPGPDFTPVSKEWLAKNIRKGPLGELYPTPKYLMEGDTPSFLYLIPNGLGQPEHPDYGSWGGRYGRLNGDLGLFSDATDSVVVPGGKAVRSNKATIWRWREAYQNDFAARMQWTVAASRGAANHAPALVVNGSASAEPLMLKARAGQEVRLSAAGSADPDGDSIRLRWFEYREVSGLNGRAAALLPEEKSGPELRATAPRVTGRTQFHVVLEGQDDGTPRLVRYRRVIVDVSP